MIRFLCLASFLLSIFYQPGQAQTINLDSTTVVVDTLITGLNVPWEITYEADGNIWMTEREGKVSLVDPNTGTRNVILDIRDDVGGPVYQAAESGLLGLALHPQFPDSNYVFLVYTFQNNGIKERMVRYEYDGSALINSVTYIDNIPGNTTHNGSRLVVGPDAKLYMTTGDAQNQPSAQDLGSLTGKTLRFNLDGSVPADNPITGSYLWSWGHRNHQGLTFGPNGILYSSEHGPNNDDEVNIIRGGRNHGWPTVQGFCNASTEIAFCNDSNIVEPLVNWTPTIAPADLVYYNHPAIPEWQNTLLLTILKEKRLIRLTLNTTGDSVTGQTIYLNNMKGRMRDICVAPDGTIYIATNGASAANSDPNTHTVLRLRNPNYVPPLIVDAGPDLSVCSGQSVQIIPTVSGGTQPISYIWSPANGLSCASCLQPFVNGLTADTEYVLTATDNNGSTATDTVRINVVTAASTPSYTINVIDTFQGIVDFNISAPAADSVLVVMGLPNDSIWAYQQNVTIRDTVVVYYNPAEEFGSQGINFNLCIYAFSSCGNSTVCDTQSITLIEWNGLTALETIAFNIHPNPTNDWVTVSGLQQGDVVSLVNLVGAVKWVGSPMPNDDQLNISTQGLPTGIYLISVERKGVKSMQKLIKY